MSDFEKYSDPDDIRGLNNTGYNPNATCVQIQPPEIINSILKLPIETEVINRAVAIYHRINSDYNFSRNRPKTIKGSKKDQLIFLCVFRAYYELDRAIDVFHAAALTGLPRNMVNQALDMYPMKFEPENFIEFYINRFNQILEEHGAKIQIQSVMIPEVIRIIKDCRETKSGMEGIQDMPSKGVAVAALYFYLNNIVNIMKQEYNSYFTEACYISWAAVRKYYDQINEYYNSVPIPKSEITSVRSPQIDWMSKLVDEWSRINQTYVENNVSDQLVDGNNQPVPTVSLI